MKHPVTRDLAILCHTIVFNISWHKPEGGCMEEPKHVAWDKRQYVVIDDM
jgi:hypothetical protein